ncbi:MAG: class A beta-lactamase-related serine hydrolase [Nitriliruptor sp.]|nr:MAG: class A beta-lactamase-related serine hydrolase [Nitriliruptor sp.]
MRLGRSRSLPVAVAAVGALLLATATAALGVSASDRDRQVDQVRERVEANLARTSVPGAAVALVDDGEVVWAEGFGLAEVATGRPVRADTMFQAGSLSKSVTAWAVLHLAAEGVIDLDAPVEEQVDGWSLPDSPYDTSGVTPRRLLAHTSGLPFAIGATPLSPARFRSGEVDQEAFTLVQEPGAGFIYSNPGYALLALVVEDTSGDDFASVLAERVLEPLGMEDATFALEASDVARSATGYTAEGEPVAPTWASPLGASGLHTTVVDLARFVAAAHGGERAAGRGVLSPAEVEQLHRPRVATAGLPHRLMTDEVAYGHFVERFDDTQLIMNAGEEEGWISGFATVPATGQGMVVLTNSRNGYPLIIEELQAWSQANQLGRPTLVGVYTGLLTGAWVAIVLLMAVSVGLVVTSARRLHAGSTPVSSRRVSRWLPRLGALGAGVLLLAVWWMMLAEVLGVFLPAMTPWLGVAVTVTGALMILRAVAPSLSARAATGSEALEGAGE